MRKSLAGLILKLTAAQAAAEDRQHLDANLRLLAKPGAEVPHRNGERTCRFQRCYRRSSRQIIQQRHLAKDRAALECTQVAYIAGGRLLRDLHLATGDDEEADAGLALSQQGGTGG